MAVIKLEVPIPCPFCKSCEKYPIFVDPETGELVEMFDGTSRYRYKRSYIINGLACVVCAATIPTVTIKEDGA